MDQKRQNHPKTIEEMVPINLLHGICFVYFVFVSDLPLGCDYLDLPTTQVMMM